MSTRIPRAGDVYQSRDEQYEPGRQVRIALEDGQDPEAASNPFWTCTTIANPSRPDRVGSVSRIRQATLVRRWRLVERDLSVPEGADRG